MIVIIPAGRPSPVASLTEGLFIHTEASMIIDYALPLAITVFSGWIVFEFLGLCYSQRRFQKMRDENHR